MGKSLLILVAAVLLCLPLRAGAGDGLVVHAAASLKGPLDEVLARWADGNAVASYGGSAAQARQVLAGAPADIVILANPDWMDWLETRGGIIKASRRDLLGNALVMVVPVASGKTTGWPDPADLPDLPSGIAEWLGRDGRLAIGHTRSVPAGQYARHWLEGAALWPQVAQRLAETENVRAALALVALAEAPAGIVYATDARAEPRVREVFRLPSAGLPPVVYPAAVTTGAGAGADALLDWLASDAAMAVFEAAGFLRPPGTP